MLACRTLPMSDGSYRLCLLDLPQGTLSLGCSAYDLSLGCWHEGCISKQVKACKSDINPKPQTLNPKLSI